MWTHEYPDPADVAGLTRCAPPPPFVPKFCTLDKKVLRYVQGTGKKMKVRYMI